MASLEKHEIRENNESSLEGEENGERLKINVEENVKIRENISLFVEEMAILKTHL